MCGIAGFSGKGDAGVAARMIDAIKHRGPDDQGVYFHEATGLAHARLSIIDLSPTGHQPMFSADGSVAVVFNGEIYNFLDLKKDLSYPFKGSSDTEVLLALYQKHGEGMFELLNGMFALALYDQKTHRLILARDRLGKKPLYYGIFGETLIFGSEIKAILAHPSATKLLNHTALGYYLRHEYVPTPLSIFEHIHKLEPGTAATWDGKRLTKTEFWRMHFDTAQTPLTEALDGLDRHLARSVESRLVSDVPLGIFLSGGIDSSTIAYYAQRASKEKIKTFSVGFSEKSFDEAAYARRVAAHLGTEHHEETLKPSDALELIPRIADLLDEPMADPSIIPTYLLSAFTRKHVTVALGGDGGDEVLAGYDPFRAERFARLYEQLPTTLRHRLIEPLMARLPETGKNLNLGFVARRFIQGMNAPADMRTQTWMASFTDARIQKLLQGPTGALSLDPHLPLDTDRTITDPGQRLIYQFLRTYLLDDILVKVDRASMFHSLEVRAPFLDYELVDFVNRLPFNYKMRGFTTKYLLKKLMKDRLPHDIVYRKKKGWGIPLSRWLKNELRPIAQDLLSTERLRRQGIFDPAVVGDLLRRHTEGKQEHHKELWTLMVFQMWYDRWYQK